MDDPLVSQNTFTAVWQRVSSSSGHAEDNSSDERGLLSALIDNEEENLAFYRAEAELTAGSCSALFGQLANISAKRLGRLRTFHYILFASEYNPRSSPIAVRGSLQALRTAYWREKHTASKLISVSASIGSGSFNSYAAEFARLAAENAEKIIHTIEQIMQ